MRRIFHYFTLLTSSKSDICGVQMRIQNLLKYLIEIIIGTLLKEWKWVSIKWRYEQDNAIKRR